MKKIIKFLGFRFNAIQYKWGRKLFGGKYYYIYPMGLQMGNFWSDKEITSCQSQTIKTETY